uniref:DUF7344 domain-containing protein n=1 Tax=Salinadaptatus halalkaliphilus TaxID=2419781 RepID=UPI001142E5EE|nr:hypothetical protein [Salinadaptatus halalkaliphilus]
MLLSNPQPLTVRDLAVELAAAIGDKPPTEVTAVERTRSRSLLVHQYLPVLEDADIVRQESDIVLVTDRTPFEGTRLSVRHLRELELPAWGWDALAALVGCPNRRRIVSLVTDRAPLSLERLAAMLPPAAFGVGRSADADGRPLQVVLHHVELPALDDVDVVEYDPLKRLLRHSQRLSELCDRAAVVRELCALESPE